MSKLIHSPLSLEEIKKVNKYGQEYWSSRELAQALGYTDYRSFSPILKKGKIACQNSGYDIDVHFVNAVKEVTDKGKKKMLITLHLSRYACYLVIQNANPNKAEVAQFQTYFTALARKQELLQNTSFEEPSSLEDQSRLLLRNEITQHNKKLAELARKAGVIDPKDFSAFQNQGYMGLYGGLDRERLHQKKGLKRSQKVLDYMGSAELAANLFRATQTEEKLKRDHIQSKLLAYKTHYDIGQKVRQTISELGGTLPEELPTPTKSARSLEKRSDGSLEKLYSRFLGKR